MISDHRSALHELVLAQVARTPDRPALCSGGVELSYAELDARANGVARALLDAGVGRSSIVGVLAERGLATPIAFLGILKAGAAFFPFDRSWPADWTTATLEAVDSRLVVAAQEDAVDRPAHGHVVGIDQTVSHTEFDEVRQVQPEDLAYVVSTSGSSGRPKLVMAEHRNIVNSTLARIDVFPSVGTYLVLPSLSFNAAFAGLFFSLVTGGCALIPTDEEVLDPALLGELVERHRVSHIDGGPSQYSALVAFGLPRVDCLKCVVLGGDTLPPSVARHHHEVLPDVPLFNEYGPTEGTVWSAVHEYRPEKDRSSVPVGLPIKNVRIYVLDEDMAPVPTGGQGEICIAGAGVVRGYLGQPGLTAERFVPDPFPSQPGARMYRTGDRGRFDEDGTLWHLGRLDTQVKVRGYRVEVSSIENTLRAHAAVAEVAVVPEGPLETTRLVAYFCVTPGFAPPRAADLAAHVSDHLPDYMVPSRFEFLERLPVTTNGKIDRRALGANVDGQVAPARPTVRGGETIDSRLVVNLEGSYAIWPTGRACPAGWRPVKAPVAGSGEREARLRSIDLDRIYGPALGTAASLSQEEDNLTRHEWSALSNAVNLADGHARQGQNGRQSAIVDDLPDAFRAAESSAQLDLQAGFESEFFRLAGQSSVLESEQRPLYHYSSSLSTEVLANYLRRRGLRVSLLHPTFDNIAAILRRHDVELMPVAEAVLRDPEAVGHQGITDVLFLVAPNNPTGVDLPEPIFRAIARWCAEQHVLLVLDLSFRFFSDQLGSFDQYAILNEMGGNYVGIEDTGKTWPTLDLKLGALVVSPRIYPELQRITDDCLLNVSPFVFELLRRYISEDEGTFAARIAATNRRRLEAALSETSTSLVSADCPMGVAWIELPNEWSSVELCAWLSARGVSVLPGGPFFWADGLLGGSFIRVALMRDEDSFAGGADALAGLLHLYGDGSTTEAVAAPRSASA